MQNYGITVKEIFLSIWKIRTKFETLNDAEHHSNKSNHNNELFVKKFPTNTIYSV